MHHIIISHLTFYHDITDICMAMDQAISTNFLKSTVRSGNGQVMPFVIPVLKRIAAAILPPLGRISAARDLLKKPDLLPALTASYVSCISLLVDCRASPSKQYQ